MKKNLLITGVSSGIGLDFLKKITVNKNINNILTFSRRDINFKHINIKHVMMDLNNPDIINEIINFESNFGLIDTVVLNAGFATNKNNDFFIENYSEFTKNNNINICGNSRIIDFFKNRKVNILFVSSVGSEIFPSGLPHYSASKMYIEKILSYISYYNKNFKYNIIQFGYIKTPMTIQNIKMPFLKDTHFAVTKLMKHVFIFKNKTYRYPKIYNILILLLKITPSFIQNKLRYFKII